MRKFNDYDPYKAFMKYSVEARDLEDLCDRYHRKGAYHDRGAEYMKVDYEHHKKEMERDGFTLIPMADSTTGDVVSYYGKI